MYKPFISNSIHGKKETLLIKLNKSSFFRKLFTCVTFYILYIRSFFIKDVTHAFLTICVPGINMVLIFLSKFYPDLFNLFFTTYALLWIGLQLQIFDYLGSRLSSYILHDPDPIVSMTTFLLLTRHPNIVVRHVSAASVTSLVIGKTAMTATGRATLMVGLGTGTVWLFNCYLDRNAMDERATVDRKAMDERATADRKAMDERATADRQARSNDEAKARAYQNYKDSAASYNTTRFYKKKGDKPTWDEAAWENWSKSR